MIETLDQVSRLEAVEVIGQAFSDHPHMPVDPSGRRSRLMVSTLLNTFAAAPDAQLFGLRRDGRLDCAAFVFDADYQPRGFTLILFLIRMIRVLGWRMSHAFAQVLSEKPEREERQLELMLIGTRTDCQQQGFGRAMIQHVLKFAQDKGYKSVCLEVAKETPAFSFYLREGFIVDKEVALPLASLCFLRRPLSGRNRPKGTRVV
jgi:ribosomal protein S18 acetylase RimI-like enzyme